MYLSKVICWLEVFYSTTAATVFQNYASQNCQWTTLSCRGSMYGYLESLIWVATHLHVLSYNKSMPCFIVQMQNACSQAMEPATTLTMSEHGVAIGQAMFRRITVTCKCRLECYIFVSPWELSFPIGNATTHRIRCFHAFLVTSFWVQALTTETSKLFLLKSALYLQSWECKNL